MEQEKKDLAGWWIWVLALVVVSTVVLNLVGAGGYVFGLFVERKALENSHQYHEARKDELVTFDAQLAELHAQLNNPTLTDGQKANIEAQIASLNILSNAARNR